MGHCVEAVKSGDRHAFFPNCREEGVSVPVFRLDAGERLPHAVDEEIHNLVSGNEG
jgi:hypothetical protein